MFVCPDCRQALTRMSGEGGVFWVCRQCGGRAMGMSLLHRLLHGGAVHGLWLEALSRREASGGPCPSCVQPMVAVAQADLPARSAQAGTRPSIGVCTRCQFVWFGPRQYEQLPKAPPPVAPEPLPAEAQKALAVGQVETLSASYEAGFERLAEALDVVGLPVARLGRRFRDIPWLSPLVVMFALVIGVIVYASPELAAEWFGFMPADPFRGSGLTLITSLFVHAGFLYLATSMFFLALFGDAVEDALGKGRLVLLFAAAVLAGDFLHAVADPQGEVPVIGLNGGVSALVLLTVLRSPHARLGFYAPLRQAWPPVWAWLIVWVALQCVGAWLQPEWGRQVTVQSQVGGAAVAFLLWLKWRRA